MKRRTSLFVVAIAVFAIAVPVCYAQTSSINTSAACGPDCLYVVLVALGVDVGNYGEYLKKFGSIHEQGVSMGEIEKVAQLYGAHTMSVNTSLDLLRRRTKPFGCIALVGNSTHFVVIHDQIGREVSVIDPPLMSRIPIDTFLRKWNGQAVLIATSPLAPESIPPRFGTLGIAVAIGVTMLLAIGWSTRNRWLST